MRVKRCHRSPKITKNNYNKITAIFPLQLQTALSQITAGDQSSTELSVLIPDEILHYMDILCNRHFDQVQCTYRILPLHTMYA